MSKKSGLIEAYAVGYSLGIKFVFILSCPIVSGVACGIWLDKSLGTTPWLMVILLIAGFVFAMYAVYRIATRFQNETN